MPSAPHPHLCRQIVSPRGDMVSPHTAPREHRSHHAGASVLSSINNGSGSSGKACSSAPRRACPHVWACSGWRRPFDSLIPLSSTCQPLPQLHWLEFVSITHDLLRLPSLPRGRALSGQLGEPIARRASPALPGHASHPRRTAMCIRITSNQPRQD